MTAPEFSSPPANHRMTPLERRASASLALIFALRMLGLFLVLPVFALEAHHYAGGEDAASVGLALGLYGLTQAVCQLPLGLASDRLGRKPVIVAGMLVFALGSLVAALADSLWVLMVGRALQGAGAVSAAVTALLADLTRDSVRTKAMAMIGGSIGLTFALALALAPLLAAWVGLPGIFALTGGLALAGAAVVLWVVPAAPEAVVPATVAQPARVWDLLRFPDVLRVNAGVFILHTVQMAMWVAVPGLLVQAGLAKDAQWQLYLPVVVVSFLAVGGLFALERRGRLRTALLAAIALVAVVQLGLLAMGGMVVGALSSPPAGGAALWGMAGLLLLFFISFNVLEASQPSMVSRMAPVALRGTALGAFNALQSLGLFAGGALGGALLQWGGTSALFAATALLAALWLLVAWPLRPAPPSGSAGSSLPESPPSNQ